MIRIEWHSYEYTMVNHVHMKITRCKANFTMVIKSLNYIALF